MRIASFLCSLGVRCSEARPRAFIRCSVVSVCREREGAPPPPLVLCPLSIVEVVVGTRGVCWRSWRCRRCWWAVVSSRRCQPPRRPHRRTCARMRNSAWQTLIVTSGLGFASAPHVWLLCVSFMGYMPRPRSANVSASTLAARDRSANESVAGMLSKSLSGPTSWPCGVSSAAGSVLGGLGLPKRCSSASFAMATASAGPWSSVAAVVFQFHNRPRSPCEPIAMHAPSFLHDRRAAPCARCARAWRCVMSAIVRKGRQLQPRLQQEVYCQIGCLVATRPLQ